MSAAILFSALTVLAASTSEVDARWTPWLGCWELVDDERRDPLVGEADPTEGQDLPKRGLMCLHPSPDGAGVTVTTAANGEAFLEETLVADGERNPSAKGACTGWQRAEWSQDGHRLFTTAELQCEENRQLQVSGLTMMVPRATWVDIQIVDSGHGRAVVIRRYRPADAFDVGAAGLEMLSDETIRDASRQRLVTTNPLDADAIGEAATKVAPEALEAAVIEHQEGFELNADTLIRLDDAGVRPGLIDLMVALSYPEQFIVERDPGPGGSGGAPGLGIPTFTGSTLSPFARPYYLAPFSYYYWYAPYDARYVVRPLAVPEVRQGLVSHQGYAQVSQRPTGRRARYRDGSGGGGDYVSSGSSGSSSGGSVSGQGYTRGGSSGRTARPRRKN